jgi:hypothetical protein
LNSRQQQNKVGKTIKLYFMAQLLAVSIDLTKIDKSQIVEGKNGGKYVNVTLSVNDTEDQYGNNVSLWQSQSKEEREAKANRNFLGNGKKLWSDDKVQQAELSKKATKKQEETNDLPW